MTLLITIPGVNWSAKNYPNIAPFIATSDLEYAFDFTDRAAMLSDVTGKHTITPKRVDAAAGILNVTDPTIITPVANGGIQVELGYLQSSLAFSAFSSGGGKQFTIMVVGRDSGAVFPPAKIVVSNPYTSILFDWGSMVTGSGFTIEQARSTGQRSSRIENSTPNLIPEVANQATVNTNVLFLTYNGTNWTLTNKTLGLTATGTNASLSVGNPIVINPVGYTTGKVNLGGHSHQGSTLHANGVIMYQQAMWNRVLTNDEMNAQYARCKTLRPVLGL